MMIMKKGLGTIVAISDTHGIHARMDQRIPDGDILVHAGDFCGRGHLDEVAEFATWFGAFPHPHKIVVPGNHDGPVEQSEEVCRGFFEQAGIHLLVSESVKIEGIHFFGVPYAPKFFDWHFMRERGAEIRAEWEAIPPGVEVLITHGPPYGHGDLALPFGSSHNRRVGCIELLIRVRELRPKIHIFGHIHEDHGVTESDEIPGTRFCNVSICDGNYRASNPPTVLNL